jgi:bifunctional DNase/RNase
MQEVIVARLGIDSATQQYVVVLQERGGERYLPIWIGPVEAEAILKPMQHAKGSRPATHDLCKALIVGLGATLRRVHITKVEKNTYFAELILSHAGGVVHVDARPSDSIAIALRLSAPIFADESLLTAIELVTEDAAGDPSESAGSPGEGLSAEQLKAHLEKLRPEDFGEFNL